MSVAGEWDDGRGLVLFIHGLWLNASSWDPWAEEFDGSGYDSITYCWPGESRTTDRPQTPQPVRVRDLAEQLTAIIGTTGRQPIAIGHGVGGLLAQVLVGQGSASAAISLAPVPCGLSAAAAAVRLVRKSPRLAWATTRAGPVTPSLTRFTQEIASSVPAPEARRLFNRYTMAGHPRTLIRSLTRPAVPQRRPEHERRGPLLLIAAGRDMAVSEASVGSLHRRYRRTQPEAATDFKIFPDRAHSLIVDSGWHAVGNYCLDWLTANGL
jgi:non-heme chloroperoxidase